MAFQNPNSEIQYEITLGPCVAYTFWLALACDCPHSVTHCSTDALVCLLAVHKLSHPNEAAQLTFCLSGSPT